MSSRPTSVMPEWEFDEQAFLVRRYPLTPTHLATSCWISCWAFVFVCADYSPHSPHYVGHKPDRLFFAQLAGERPGGPLLEPQVFTIWCSSVYIHVQTADMLANEDYRI